MSEEEEKPAVSSSLPLIPAVVENISHVDVEERLFITQSDDTQTDLDDLDANTKTIQESPNDSTYMEQELIRLRELVSLKTNENISLENRLQESEQQFNLRIEQLNQNFTQRLEQTLKKFQEGHKDKTSSLVMKYAEGEKRCIDLNRNIEHLQSKLQDSIKEKQNLVDKYEKVKLDAEKMNFDFEKKCQEILNAKKECEKLKESLVLSEAREKAFQLKLKQEIDAHLLTKEKYQQYELEKEKEQQQSSDQDKTPIVNELITQSVDEQTTSQQTQLIIDEKYERTIKELNALKSQLKDMFEERITFKDRLQCMEQERKLQESSLSKYKEILQSQKQMNKELLNEILQLRELQETLTKEKIEKENLETKFKLISAELTDLQSDMQESQTKQNELLSFTSKLTEKNSQLQSENTTLSEKLSHLQIESSTFKEQNDQINSSTQIRLNQLSDQLKAETKKCKEQTELLNEKQKQIDDLNTKLNDEQSEMVSLKKKHAANLKDLSRQLQLLQKKVNSNDTSSANSCPSTSPNNKPIASRTNSFTSLNGNEILPLNAISSNSAHRISDDDSKSNFSIGETHMTKSISSNNHFNNEVICGNDDVYVVDIDKQKIIEKIVKLQNTLAKKNEKIDFLQDHVNQLTSDLKRKTKIIQAYAMNEEVGQFTSEMHDAIKREMSRKTGSIMSALYSNSSSGTKSYTSHTSQLLALPNDSHMTMELCTEINGKLQALLEDTLIKNLTLKDNLETLGQEISRLSKENRQIKLNSISKIN